MFEANEIDFQKAAVIDWLTVRIDFLGIVPNGQFNYKITNEKAFYELLQILGFHGYISDLEQNKGFFGSTHGYRLGEFITISYGNLKNQTAEGQIPLILDITGQGCREFETYFKGDWLKLFGYLVKNIAYEVTRLDFAIDDFTGHEITLDELIHLYNNKLFATKARKGMIIISDNIFSEHLESTGKTLYIGSRQSSTHMRIYNKLLELNEKGKATEVCTNYYTRFETTFKGEKARHILEAIYENKINLTEDAFMQFYAKLLYEFIDFKDPLDKHSRVREKKTSPKWLDFLSVVSKMKIKLEAPAEITLEKKDKWIKGSLASTFYEQFALKGIEGALEFQLEMVDQILDHLKPQILTRINKARMKQGKTPFDEKEKEALRQTMKMLLSEANNINEETGELEWQMKKN